MLFFRKKSNKKLTLEFMDARGRDVMAMIWEGIWPQRNQAWLGKQVEASHQVFLQTTTNLRSFKRAQ